MLDMLSYKLVCHIWAIFYCIPRRTLEKGLTITEGDGDMKKMYDMAETYGLIDLYITHIPKNLAEYYYKNLTFNVTNEEPCGSVANVPDEELEMVVAGLVANNAVGVEVIPPSVVRCWQGVYARLVAQLTVIPLYFKKIKHVVLADHDPSSPKSVPNFAPSDEACKTLSGETTKG
nr:transposase, MuDR, MULE transposase domain protein [Tanacetum cinerariifolium]